VDYISKQQFKQCVEEFNFTLLFNRLGWSYIKHSDPVQLEDLTFTLDTVAEKSGFRILVCGPDNKGKIPNYSVRMKLDRIISKLYGEHLIIFQDQDQKTQLWQWVLREPGKPPQISESYWYRGQEPELLYQKTSGLFFTLDEEENITIVDVTSRVRENFQQNREKVTKKFYDVFKKEQKNFRELIEGIESETERDWYASLMLNRLMFCYFIQRKGFLDNNKNYLRDKLQACQQKKGKNKFYSFYRNFLLALFHRGLGEPVHSDELKAELGNVPYLNGGLFNSHQLERSNPDIQIEDQAFARIFAFFDQYNWHLDTRISASGKDINPDVIGYIFEKYINDRAQMGAYYTKEDITDYISKNCILPYLFDETERHYAAAFAADGWIWSMLKNSGDAYIYDAVKYGIDPDDIWGDLPDDIRAGLDPEQPDLVDKRRCWNRSAPAEVALPTEIWREVIERRQRYLEVRTKIERGEITSINDFITYNLNIRQFTRDIIEECEDSDFILHFYKSMAGDGKSRAAISILDPTCGSGAFLFAAMNILEPLYEACLQRMDDFLAVQPKKHKFFAEILEKVRVPEHPNRQYFIFKSIILNNLYGVDIMHEAVEIAKLRLFLKLVATVEPDYKKPNQGLEPLPDIDYNIRAGNTLIGYASEAEVDQAFSGQLDFDNDAGKLKEQCEQVAMAFNRYKTIQLGGVEDYSEFHRAKGELEERLTQLNHDLNLQLHKQSSPLQYDTWLETHKPFNWFAEFYEIIHIRGGFDVIIGNPPYVVYTKKDRITRRSIADIYNLNNYYTLSSNNLYAFVIERSITISKEITRLGMIVPVSSVSSDGFLSLQKILLNSLITWVSSYSNRPGKLFENVEQRLTIIISKKTENPDCMYHSSSYKHWYSQERPILFDTLSYCQNNKRNSEISFSKIGNTTESLIMQKVFKIGTRKLGEYLKPIDDKHGIYYHNGPTYFVRAMSFMPNSKQGFQSSSHYKPIYSEINNAIVAVLNSSIYYFFYKNFSNCRDFSDREINAFPLGQINKGIKNELDLLEACLNDSYIENMEIKNRNYESGLIFYEEYYPAKSKPIIDDIDIVLAQHYGFTYEELDFIINYDIKYRMGKELEGDEE
jgi:hypothetical protein